MSVALEPGNVQRLGDWESPLAVQANGMSEKYVDSLFFGEFDA